MTKKDYELIAGVIRKTQPDTTQSPCYLQWFVMNFEIQQALEDDNPRFDRVLFGKACIKRGK